MLLRRQNVLPELRFTNHHNAGPSAWRIPAFKCGCAGAGFARLDGGKAHRGLTRNTQNRAVLIEHPWLSLLGSAEMAHPYVQDCSLNELSPLITEQPQNPRKHEQDRAAVFVRWDYG
jgi:hypothetical protein